MFYFAYGSNMNLDQMRERKVSYQNPRKAFLMNYKLGFTKTSERYNNIGVADIIESKGNFVEGVLYEVTEEGMANLDKFEGIEQNVYKRVKVVVQLESGEELETITYKIINEDKPFIPPAKEYMDKIIKGAETHRLSKNYIQKLKAIPLKEITND